MEGILETGRLVNVWGSVDIGRITAIEVEHERIGIAVECTDGVHWFSEHDITSSKASAQTRHKGMKDDFGRDAVELMTGDDSATDANQ